MVAILLFLSTSGCQQEVSGNTVKCKEYSLTLPSKFNFKMEEDKHPSTSFFYKDVLVGQVVLYQFEFDDAVLRSDKVERERFFETLISATGIDKERNQDMTSFSGDSKYGIYEMWFGTKDGAKSPISEYHYFMIAGENLICDIWFDNMVFTSDDIKATMDSFKLST